MKKLAILLMFLMFSIILASCSKVQEIENRSESMNKTSKKVLKTTEKVKESTDSLLKMQRQYSSSDLRSTQIATLYNQESDMEDKLLAAKKLMLSFEYQLWNPSNSFDTIEYREELITEAVREFLFKVGGVHSELMETNIWGKTKLDRMSPLKIEKKRRGKNKFNNEMIFYALATNLDVNNILQEKSSASLAKNDLEVLSLFDIITNALIKDFENRNLTIAEEVVVTGKFKQVAIDLLKARFNFLITLAVTSIIDQENQGVGNRLSQSLFNFSRGRIGRLKFDSIFNSHNTATQMDINKKLEAAINTRNILNSIGQEALMVKELGSILRNLQISESETLTKEASQFLTYIDILSSEY